MELNMEFHESNMSFDMEFQEVIEITPDRVPAYDGPYSVKPSFEEQVLETAGLLLTADINVKQIPLSRVTNNSGGMTVIIGG